MSGRGPNAQTNGLASGTFKAQERALLAW